MWISKKKKTQPKSGLDIFQRIFDSLGKRDLACSVFLYFEKAFENVDSKVLISKLKNYRLGGSALQWFESYLSSKRQVAKIDDVLSEKRYISCGVQQSNILGSILFLLYIKFH